METKDNKKEVQEQNNTQKAAAENPFKNKLANEGEQDLTNEADQEQQFKEAQTERD